MRKNRLFLIASTIVLLLLVGLGIAQRADQGFSALLVGWRDELSLDKPVDISSLEINFGVYDPSQKFAGSPRMAFDHIFVSWLDDNRSIIESTTRYASERGRWGIMVTIEPYARKKGNNTVDSLFTDIRDGDYDPEINQICSIIADQGRPVFIRWGHEMDVVTGRYDWAQHDADGYVESFRYFVSNCRAIVPDSWYVWSPISEGAQMHRYWPGGGYVDRIGLPIFGFPERDLDLFGRLRSFPEIFDEKYERTSIYKKQIMIAEIGIAGDPDYQRRWMMQLFRSLEDYPLLKELVYFDSKDNIGAWEEKYSLPDWRIDSDVFE